MTPNVEGVTKGRRKRRTKKQTKGPFGFRNPYVLKGLKYCEDVLSGVIPACKWTKLACQRQINDLERAKRDDPDFPFIFDEELGGRAAEFLEQLPHTQGPLAFQHEDGSWNTLTLELWQCFAVTTLYGWIRKDTGGRRFLRSLKVIPRGNGKSFELSGLMLLSFTEGEQGVESYSAAVDRDQASKVYGEAVAMLQKRPDLECGLGLEVSATCISQPATHSFAKALSREAKKTGDGKNIYFAAVDEFHAHPTREVWGVLDTGTGKRAPRHGRGPLICIITTSGFNTSGVCYEKQEYCQKILEGVIKDETWFAIIYTIDDEEEWTDSECRAACTDHSHPSCAWRKANPNWGVSVDPIDFAAKANAAIQTASEQNNFKTKHLNVWCNADQAWMDMGAWDRCGDPNLSRSDFAGQDCYIGLDLASRVDICAKAMIFPRIQPHRDPAKAGEGETERHYYLFVDSYIPEESAKDSINDQYAGWVKEGRLITTPGETLDLSRVREDVTEDSSAYTLREVAYDPAQANELSHNLIEKGLTLVEVRPLVLNFSEPMKELEAAAIGGRLHHDANPAMRWMVSNVVCHRDAKDNIYPRKTNPKNKIDGVVAAIMALSRAVFWDGPSQCSYLESNPMVML